MTSGLSSLERAVLEKLLEGNFPLLMLLKQQLELCEVVKREFTGVGFYTKFRIPNDALGVSGLDTKFGDVIGIFPDLQSGAGFLLYVKNGILDMLEGYTFGEPWPTSLDRFSLQYIKGENRDWADVPLLLRVPTRK